MNSVALSQPHNPAQLWKLILPFLEEELQRISSLIPPEEISPRFQEIYLSKVESTFFSKVDKKTDFAKWVLTIKNWFRWAKPLIPYKEINTEYVKKVWDKLCYLEPNANRHSGLAPETVRKVLFKRPNDFDREDFLDIILSETCLRFMKYYFSSFRPPMERWLYVQAESAAKDFVQDWVPGLKIEDEELRPKGFVSIIKKSRDYDKGSEEIPLEPKEQPCDHWLLTRYAFVKHYNANVGVISLLRIAPLYTKGSPMAGWPHDLRPHLRTFLAKLITQEEIRYAQEHKLTCSSCGAFLDRLDFYMSGVVYEAARPFIEEFEKTELIRLRHGLTTATSDTKATAIANRLGKSILGKLKTLKETLDTQPPEPTDLPAGFRPVKIHFTSPISFAVPEFYADVEDINRREATKSAVDGPPEENGARTRPATIFSGSVFGINQTTEKLGTDRVPVVQETISRISMTDTGTVEKALRAQQEAQELRQLAIKELLEQQEDISRKLVQLGHTAAATPRRGRPPKTPVVATSSSTKTCKVCGQSGHNARRHKKAGVK